MKFITEKRISFIRICICSFILSLTISHCGKGDYRPMHLPSGGTINIMGVKHVTAVLSDGTITYPKLEYESYINIEDPEALHKELREIWPQVLKELEGSNVDFIQIAAFDVDSRIFRKSRITPFRKDKDGIWHSPALPESPKKAENTIPKKGK